MSRPFRCASGIHGIYGQAPQSPSRQVLRAARALPRPPARQSRYSPISSRLLWRVVAIPLPRISDCMGRNDTITPEMRMRNNWTMVLAMLLHHSMRRASDDPEMQPTDLPAEPRPRPSLLANLDLSIEARYASVLTRRASPPSKACSVLAEQFSHRTDERR